MQGTLQAKSKVGLLLERLRGKKRILIMSHTNPDPDSMGGGFGMRYLIEHCLEIPTTFGYRGNIFRAENVEMVNTLGLGLVPEAELDVGRFDGLVVVDTQPGFGHTKLPKDMVVDGVIDHHVPPPKAPKTDGFVDVRTNVGATCSIIAGYLMELGMEIPSRVATALFYGIRTDTADLSRNTSKLDEDTYLWLMARCDRSALARISSPTLPKEYFSAFRTAMNATRIYGKVIVCSLGQTSNPQIVAEMADLLLRLHGCEWVVTGGLYDDIYFISVRARDYDRDAWALLDSVLKGEGSFGGHGTVGGGSVPIKDPSPRGVRRLERKLVRNLLEALGESQTTPVSLA